MLLMCWAVPQDHCWGWGSCWRLGSSLPLPGNRPQLPREATSFWSSLPPPPTVPVLPLGAARSVQPPRGQEWRGGAAEHRAQARPPPVFGGLSVQTHWGSPRAAGADLGGAAPGQLTARLLVRAPYQAPGALCHAPWPLQSQLPPAPEQGVSSWVFTAPRTPEPPRPQEQTGLGGRQGRVPPGVCPAAPVRVVCHSSPLRLPLPPHPAPHWALGCVLGRPLGRDRRQRASQWPPPSVVCLPTGTPDPRASHLTPRRPHQVGKGWAGPFPQHHGGDDRDPSPSRAPRPEQPLHSPYPQHQLRV